MSKEVSIKSRELTLSDFKIVRVLGKGEYGEVVLARHKPDGLRVAIKIIRRWADEHPQESRQRIQQEIQVLKRLDPGCPFLIRYLGSFPVAFGTSIILEFVPGGNLQVKLKNQSGGFMKESVAKFYVAEIACALESLGSMKIVHGDLKLDNILLTSAGHIKLTDFGLAGVLENGHDSKPRGALFIRSPQIIRGEPYTIATDWYSMGVSLYEMVVGVDPFLKLKCRIHSDLRKCTNDCLRGQILRGKIEYPLRLSHHCRELIGLLMSRDEADRLQCLEDMVSHPWFSDLNWEELRAGRVRPPASKLKTLIMRLLPSRRK